MMGGSLATRSNDKDIMIAFWLLLPNILRIQCTILLVKYIDSTVLSQTASKLACRLV